MSSAEQDTSPRQRFSLARRVKRALGEVDGVVLLHIDDELPERAQPQAHGDFVIQALDLRVRIVLLVGIEPSPEGLVIRSVVDRAETLLSASPDTAAVALVFDNEVLTTCVVEPFDAFGHVLAPSGQRSTPTLTEGPGPLVEVLSEYLRLLHISWQPWTHSSTDTLELSSLARESAERAVAERQRQSYRVPEKQLARDSLGKADAGWLAEFTHRALLGELPHDLEDEVRRRGARS